MPYDVKLPDIGEGIAEGEIVRWLVKPGDAVREDQPLVEVMTDKASVEIPSPRTGVIAALLAEEGQVVPVGSALLAIALPGDPGHAAPSDDQDSGTAGAARAAKAQAAEEETTRWNNEGGAIPEVATRIPSAGPGGAPTAAPAARAEAVAAPGGPEERLPLRGLRRKIAEHMRRSIETAAHFTFVAECDMTEVSGRLAALKPRAASDGVRLTYLAFVLKALIDPLRRYPLLNASLDDERQEIVLKRYYHIGVATHTPEGLTVPVIRDA